MSLLKQLDRGAKTSWCPSSRFKNLLVSGTIAGTIDDSFEAKSSLEIYDLDLSRNLQGSEARLRGTTITKDCFHSITWGHKGIEDGSYPFGLIAGGMSDGSVNIWNPAAILNAGPLGNPLLSRYEIHKGQVLGLQFHPTEGNLLASGGTDGEVYIWDLASPSAPKPQKPNAQASAQTRSSAPGITALAWNKKVPQIIATTTEVGETSIWDLRQKRAIITFRNSSRISVRAMGLSWNPEASVNLAICYANHPVAEIWDLRSGQIPKLRLEGAHTGSILGIDWCPHDSDIVLTTGEDQRVIAWEATNGTLLHDYQFHNSQASFDLQWHPHIPGLVSSSSFDSKVSFHSIQYTGLQHVPKWLKKPSGVSFGFGGRMADFFSVEKQDKPAAGPSTKSAPPSPTSKHQPKITISQVNADPSLLNQSSTLQSVLERGQYKEFCELKLSNAKSPHDIATWTYMNILFTDETQQRSLLLNQLGFKPSELENVLNSNNPTSQPGLTAPQEEIPEDKFFDQDFSQSLPEETATQGADQTESSNVAAPLTENSSSSNQTSKSGEFVESKIDSSIREALIFGDFRSAVRQCLAAGRMADAITFASFGPPDLWEETRTAFFAHHANPFIKNVMKSVLSRDMVTMVNESLLSQWKQTLAVLITYTVGDEYRSNVNLLGSRLEATDVPAATVCYMCASNIDKAIEIWSRHSESFQDAIEKITLLAQAAQKSSGIQSRYLSSKFSEYAGVLAGEGGLVNAWNYLCVVAQTNPTATANDNNTSILLDRIFHAQTLDPSALQSAPPFPFVVDRVQPDPQLQSHSQQYLAIKAQREGIVQQQLRTAQANRPSSHAAPGANMNNFSQPQYTNQGPNPYQPNSYNNFAPNQGYTPAPAQNFAAPNNFANAGANNFQNRAPMPAGNNNFINNPPGGPAGSFNPQNPNVQNQYNPNPQAMNNPYHPGPGVPATFQNPNNQYPNQNQFAPSTPAAPVGPVQNQFAPSTQPPLQNPQQLYPNPSANANPYQNQANQPQSFHNPQAASVPAPNTNPYNPPLPNNNRFTPGPTPTPTPSNIPSNPNSNNMALGSQQTQNPYNVNPSQTPYAHPSTQGINPSTAPGPTPSLTPGPGPVGPGAGVAPSGLGVSNSNVHPNVVPPAAQPSQGSGSSSPYSEILEALANKVTNTNLKAAESKKLAEIKSNIPFLANKIATATLTPSGTNDLAALIQSTQTGDYNTAHTHLLVLVRTDWQNNDTWIQAFKFLLGLAKKQ